MFFGFGAGEKERRVEEGFDGVAEVDFYRQRPPLDPRIHILGVGSLGRFMAHSLRGLPNPPPVTVMFHGRQTLKKWNESPKTIKLITDGVTEVREGFDAELVQLRRRLHGKEIDPVDATTRRELGEGESDEPISSLIICTKSQMVLQALSAVKHRLHKDSVILFMQNGMGTVEEVTREIFPDPETRPRYMRAVRTYRTQLHPADPFTAIYKGDGTMGVALLPHEREGGAAPFSPTPRFSARDRLPVEARHPAKPNSAVPSPQDPGFEWMPNDRYLLRTLTRSPVLMATGLSPPDLLQMQLERLAISSILGPISVMLDARHGGMLYNYAISRTMRLLLAEISLVIRSLPELQYIPNVSQRFDPGHLETFVVAVARIRKDEINSMLEDVRRGRQTEVDYLNGWIVKKGEELGIQCFMNFMMLNLVKGKANMIQLEMSEDVPFVSGPKPGEGSLRIKESVQEELEEGSLDE
ncbi:hypothetical protein M011DRAFT_491281 [Sporormia fimetaria CBS 119925]|uniref:6-phosphogluconate dehydrogenase C-terminal domain-like protein n=1 Tax=Sporormia fimetaria CBS 119925 TaxID=1340428 RepID=A0A6A6VNI4_9PLEO|nr:hypothetical protein M011DRAFT_491281 [Sporormia fimetaria CBS 119925]